MSRVTLMPKPVIAAQISSIISSPISPIIETSGAVALPDLLSNLILSLDMEEVSGGALDSSGNNYVFDPSADEPIQSTGQSLGYMSRLFDSVSSNYFIRSHSDTELTIGNNEWACHFWVYNNIGAASTAILSKSSAVGFGTNAASSMQLLYQSTIAKTLRLTVGLEPAASGSVTITTPSNYFPGSTWVPVLIYHDPNADVVGLKVGSNVAQTASISTGVRHGTNAWTIGALDSGTPQYARIKMAALRMWRGTGVINQIVNNSTALAFLNAQQRRHSELPSAGGSFDADAQAFFTAAGITDSTQKSAINTLVLGLKSNSIWTKMKAIYPFVGGSASAHAVNLKSPGTYNITWSGGITHDSNGVQGNGSTGYGNTGLNPRSVLTLHDAHISVYLRTNSAITGVEIGAYDSTYLLGMYCKYTDGIGYGLQNNPNDSGGAKIASGANSSSAAMYTLSRTSSADGALSMYRNSTVGATTGTSNAPYLQPNTNLFLLAQSSSGSPGTYSDRQVAFTSIGDGLASTDVGNLYSLVQAYQTTLGRQV